VSPHSPVDYVKNYWSSLERFTDGYSTNEVADEHQERVIDASGLVVSPGFIELLKGLP